MGGTLEAADTPGGGLTMVIALPGAERTHTSSNSTKTDRDPPVAQPPDLAEKDD